MLYSSIQVKRMHVDDAESVTLGPLQGVEPGGQPNCGGATCRRAIL
jgi:hypothetical protein